MSTAWQTDGHPLAKHSWFSANSRSATSAIETKTKRAGEVAVEVVQTKDDLEDTEEEVLTAGYASTHRRGHLLHMGRLFQHVR